MSSAATPLADSRLAKRRRAARAALGIPENCVVVLALPPITTAHDPMLAAWSYKLFNKARGETRFVLPRAGDEYYTLLRFFEATRHLPVLVTPPADMPLETMFDAADLGVTFPAGTAEGDPVRRAHAAGLPLLLSASAAQAGGVEGRPGVAISATLTAKAIAEDLLKLFERVGT